MNLTIAQARNSYIIHYFLSNGEKYTIISYGKSRVKIVKIVLFKMFAAFTSKTIRLLTEHIPPAGNLSLHVLLWVKTDSFFDIEVWSR